MSRMTDFTVPSTVPGRTLHAFCCEPEGEVRAVLQLSHGMVEFIDRYKPLAEYLAGQGIVVVGHDHLGHGGSIRTKADYGYFAEPDGNRAVLDDLHAMTLRTKERYPGVPYFLLGHHSAHPVREHPFPPKECRPAPTKGLVYHSMKQYRECVSLPEHPEHRKSG